MPLCVLDGGARVHLLLLCGLQRREMLAVHVALHRARDLHDARVLLDRLDERLHGRHDLITETEQTAPRHFRVKVSGKKLPK